MDDVHRLIARAFHDPPESGDGIKGLIPHHRGTAVRHKTADTPARKPVSRQWVTKILKKAVARVEPDLNIGTHTMRQR